MSKYKKEDENLEYLNEAPEQKSNSYKTIIIFSILIIVGVAIWLVYEFLLFLD